MRCGLEGQSSSTSRSTLDGVNRANAAMWAPDVMQHAVRLCARTRVRATYSVAGDVRRGRVWKARVRCEKKLSFAGKRDAGVRLSEHARCEVLSRL